MIDNAKYEAPIGLLGGTFNPIHHGHLRLALELYEQLELAKVLLIPSAQPPHRAPPSVNSQRRLEMVQAAITGVKGLSVDGRELQRQGPSYMVDTLDSLREDYPHNPLCLILGMDAFMGLPLWHQWERLISLSHFLVVRRPNSVLPKEHAMYHFLKTHQATHFDHLKKQSAGAIWMVEIPAIAISATQIRGLIAAGKNPRYLLPQAVLDIINADQLYR